MAEPENLSLIKTDDDVRERLVPVLLGGDILTYSYVRCFHSAYGIRSLVLAGFDAKTISSSRFADLRVVPGVDREEVALEALRGVGAELAAQGKVPIVMGTGDWYARTLSKNKEELQRWFVVPYIDFDLLDEITQKERFYQICDELGIDYPKTWVFDCADPQATIDTEQLPFPVIAKPSNSARYHYAQIPNKKKIYQFTTPGELTELFDNLKASSYDRELIVQDMVPGADDGLRTITCYSDASGDVRVWSTGHVLLEDHMPTAIGNPVCIMLERNDAIAGQAARFLKHVGYHGYSNFDVKFDPRDGRYRFFEVNTRPGRNSFYMTIGGVNFVTLAVEDMVLHRQVPRRVACDEGMYSVVPRIVVNRTVKDAELRRQAVSMFDTGKVQNPLFYREDTPTHNMWSRLQYFNQVRKFKRYVWDVSK
ncbi:MAG: hypothetical protein SOI26_02200 [Coriobacteriales bacterium]|jgi:D-aspartate ligase